MARKQEKEFISHAWERGLKFDDIDWNKLQKSFPRWDLDFVKKNVKLGPKFPTLEGTEVVAKQHPPIVEKGVQFAKDVAAELTSPITMLGELPFEKILGFEPGEATAGKVLKNLPMIGPRAIWETFGELGLGTAAAGISEMFPRIALHGPTMKEMMEAQDVTGLKNVHKDTQRMYELNRLMTTKEPHKGEPTQAKAVWSGIVEMLPLGEHATGYPESTKMFPRSTAAGRVYSMAATIPFATKVATSLFPRMFGKGTYKMAPGLAGRMLSSATDDFVVGPLRRAIQLPITGAIYGQLRRPGDPVASVEDAIGFTAFGMAFRTVFGVAGKVLRRAIKREPTPREIREIIEKEVVETETALSSEVKAGGKTWSDIHREVSKELSSKIERAADGIVEFDPYGKNVPWTLNRTGVTGNEIVVALNDVALGKITQVFKVKKVLPENKVRLARVTGKYKEVVVDTDKVVDINAVAKVHEEVPGLVELAFKDEPRFIRAVMGPEVEEAVATKVIKNVKTALKQTKKPTRAVDWKAWDKARDKARVKGKQPKEEKFKWKFREPKGPKPISVEPKLKRKILGEPKTLAIKRPEAKIGKETLQEWLHNVQRGWKAIKDEYGIDLTKFSRKEMPTEKPRGKLAGKLTSLIDDVIDSGNIKDVRKTILASKALSKQEKLMYLRDIRTRIKERAGPKRVVAEERRVRRAEMTGKSPVRVIGGLDIWNRIVRDFTQMVGRRPTNKDIKTNVFKEILRTHGLEPEPVAKQASRLAISKAAAPAKGTKAFTQHRINKHIKRIWGLELNPKEAVAFGRIFKETFKRDPMVGDFTRRKATTTRAAWEGSFSDVNKPMAEVLAKVRPLSKDLSTEQVATKYIEFAKSKHEADVIKLKEMAKSELALGIGDKSYKKLVSAGIVKSVRGRPSKLQKALYERRLKSEIDAIKAKRAAMAEKLRLRFEREKALEAGTDWEQIKLAIHEQFEPYRVENRRLLELLQKKTMSRPAPAVKITKHATKSAAHDAYRNQFFDYAAKIDEVTNKLEHAKLADKKRLGAELLGLQESQHQLVKTAAAEGHNIKVMTTLHDLNGPLKSTFWRLVSDERGEFEVLRTVKGLRDIVDKIDGFMIRSGVAKFLYQAKNMVKSDTAKDALNLIEHRVDPARAYYTGYFRVLLEDIGLFGKDLFNKGLSVADAKKAYWYRHGRLKASDVPSHVKEIADSLTPILDLAIDIARKAGMKGIKKMTNYTPRPWKREVVEKIWTDLVILNKDARAKATALTATPTEKQLWDAFVATTNEWIKQGKFDKKITRRSIGHLLRTNQAKSYAEAAMLLDEPTYNNYFKRSAHLERHRKVIELPKDIYEDDLRVVMGTYIADFAKRVAEVEAFGQRGERLQAMLSKMIKEGNSRDAEIVSEIVRTYTGAIYRDKAFLGKKFKKFTQAFMGYQVTTKIGLGLATIPQTTQALISTFPIVRLRDWVGAGFDILSPTSRRWAKLTGAPSKAGTRAYIGYQPVGLAGKMAEISTKASGFQLLNKALQYHSVFAMKRWAPYLHKTAQGKVKRAWAIRQMKRWGLDHTKPLTDADIVSAAYKFSSKTQLLKDPLTEPMLMNHPALTWLAIFKRFGYKQAILIKENTLAELKHGNPIPLLKMAVGGYVAGEVAGYARNMVKTFLSGRKHYRDDDVFLQRLVNNFAYAGTIGWVSDIARVDRATVRSLISNINKNAQFLALPVAYSDTKKMLNMATKFGETLEARGIWPATRRIAPDVVKTGGGVLIGHASERLKTEKQRRDTKKFLRSRARQRALDFYLGGQWNRGRTIIRKWNAANRDFRLPYPTAKEILNERQRRKKLKKEF